MRIKFSTFSIIVRMLLSPVMSMSIFAQTDAAPYRIFRADATSATLDDKVAHELEPGLLRRAANFNVRVR